MEEKLKIIDQIAQFHPAYGIDAGYSWYVGGMKDTGEWKLRKMLDEPIEKLSAFLAELQKPSPPPRELTEEEKVKANTYIKTPNGGFMTQLYLDDITKFKNDTERKMFFGE